MSATLGHTNEIAMKLKLSDQAKRRLEERAAQSGRDVAEYTSELVERAVTSPTIDEILAPVREQVAQSGMSEAELMDFGRDLLRKVRAERKAKPS